MFGNNKIVKSIFDKCAEMIFPRFCLVCGAEGSLLCQKCEDKWKMKPKWDVRADLYSFGAYADKTTRKLIGAWKYDYDKSAYGFLEKNIIENIHGLEEIVKANKITEVIPIPLHNRRLRERGFDQAEVFAHTLASVLDLEVVNGLSRKRYTKPQARRNNENDRKTEMKNNPFVVNNNIVGKKILLVDDVWTTGATALAAKKALLDSEVEKVFICSIAHG